MATPSQEMIDSLGSIPAGAEAPAGQQAQVDPREATINALHGIDAHLMNDSVLEHLKPEETKQLQEMHKTDPNGAYDKAMQIATPRLIQKLVPPMAPETWQGLRAFAGDQAVNRAEPGSVKSAEDAAALREIGMKSFDDTLGKHAKYVVQQPKGVEVTKTTVAAAPAADDLPPLVAPKRLAAPQKTPGSQFARSLLDIVRGASEVGGQQQKTGKSVNDALFAKILAGAPVPRSK